MWYRLKHYRNAWIVIVSNAALNSEVSSGIIEDYRGIPVYSAYQKLQIPGLNWVILSEIDVEEATIPLAEMRRKLILITLVVIVLAFLISMFMFFTLYMSLKSLVKKSASLAIWKNVASGSWILFYSPF